MNKKVVASAAALFAVSATAYAIALLDQPTYALARTASECEVTNAVSSGGREAITKHEPGIRTATSGGTWVVVDEHERLLDGTTRRTVPRVAEERNAFPAKVFTCHYADGDTQWVWFKYH